MGKIDVDNCLGILQFAQQFSCPRLVHFAKDFICQHFKHRYVYCINRFFTHSDGRQVAAFFCTVIVMVPVPIIINLEISTEATSHVNIMNTQGLQII